MDIFRQTKKSGFNDDGDKGGFLKLLLANQARIYSFILTLVPNYADAEDILQDTSELMWKKYDQFRPGSDFVSWGVKIAQYKIYDYRKKKNKKSLVYDDELLQLMQNQAQSYSRNTDNRLDALKSCLSKLKDRDRSLIEMRYYQMEPVGVVAERIGMTVDNVYKTISRIHGRLLACVRRVLNVDNR